MRLLSLEKGLYWGHIGIMENIMETTIYWGYIGDYIGDYYKMERTMLTKGLSK